VDTKPKVSSSPTALNAQPIAFPGRLATISAPTTMNVVNTGRNTQPSTVKSALITASQSPMTSPAA
jgi:hypothetical protein